MLEGIINKETHNRDDLIKYMKFVDEVGHGIGKSEKGESHSNKTISNLTS